jgi:hypothetical protein
MQFGHSGLRQPDARSGKQLTGFPLGEPQVCCPDLGQLARQAQLVQAQREITAGCLEPRDKDV